MIWVLVHLRKYALQVVSGLLYTIWSLKIKVDGVQNIADTDTFSLKMSKFYIFDQMI